MSSKHGPGLPRDEYLTPREVVEAAVKKLRHRYPQFEPVNCLEPGCAWGAHLDYALDYFPTLAHTIGVDIFEHPMHPAHEFVLADFLTWQTSERFDLIMTNPPFSIAEACFLKAKSLLAPGGLALMFERYGFFTSKKRRIGETRYGVWRPGLWTQINLREVWVCTRRPAMIGQESTDSCEYAYYLFDSSLPGGLIRLDWLDW